MILALPLLPLVAGLALTFVRGWSRLLAVAGTSLLVTLVLGIWAATTEPSFQWEWSPAIQLGLHVEGFSRVMVVLVPLVAIPIVAYAASTEVEGRSRLLALMLAFVGAMLLLVSSADFLTLLIAWELVGATSWALIGHGWREVANTRSATQAFLTTRFGDLGLYVAAGLLYAETGSFAFEALAGVDRPAIDAIAAGVLLAAAAKSAQLPFSPWLFSAMAGPTPVSALLHSATLVAAGAYLLVRISPQLQPADWFPPLVAGIGLASALAGGVVAMLQTHVKRVLAGSTTAQYGLMFVAVGASSTAAAGAHLVAHAVFKSLLFLAAGVAIHAAASVEMADMRLRRRLRLTAILSGVGVLALAAVPPLGAAWTKEQILAAAAHSSIWLAVGALAAGLLSAFYAARFMVLVWGQGSSHSSTDGGTPGEGPRLEHKPGLVEVGSMTFLALVTVFLAILWLPGADGLVENAASGEFFESAAWEVAVSVGLIAAAFGLVKLLFLHGNLINLGLSPSLQGAAGDWLLLPAAAQLLVVDPVLASSRRLAEFDERVVDAGVRLTARLAALFSRLFSLRVEWTIDGAVLAVSSLTMRSAEGGRRADEAAIDGAVEGGVRSVGFIAAASRRLQTGQSHQYYVLVAVGLVVIAAVLGIAI